MSHLDRFLLTQDWVDLFPRMVQVALPNVGSDHTPILLHQ